MNIDNLKNNRIIQTENTDSQKNLPSDAESFSQEFKNLQQEMKDNQQQLENKNNIEANKSAMIEIQQVITKDMQNRIVRLNSIKSKIISDSDIKTTHRIDISKLNEFDLDLFNKLNDEKEVQIGSINNQTQQINMIINGESNTTSYKSIEVSSTILNIVDEAFKTNKPVRLDFDNDASVILRIDSKGKIIADFIPGDKAMEMIMRSALPELRQKFEQQNIPYSQLSYREHKGGQNRNNQQQKEAEQDE